MSTITVKDHKRRRTGKTARVSQALGYGTDVKVGPYIRKRPARLGVPPGKTAQLSHALGYGTDVKVGPYVRKRPDAVPTWGIWSLVEGKELYKGRYKDKHLAVMRNPEGGWYWEVTDMRAGLLAQGVARDAGKASREAELAAGYEYAGEVLKAGMAFQDPTERPA